MIQKLILIFILIAGEYLSVQPINGSTIEDTKAKMGVFQLINHTGRPIVHVYLIPDSSDKKWLWRKDYALPKGQIADKESRTIGIDEDDYDANQWFLRVVFSDGSKAQFSHDGFDLDRIQSLTLTITMGSVNAYENLNPEEEEKEEKSPSEVFTGLLAPEMDWPEVSLSSER